MLDRYRDSRTAKDIIEIEQEDTKYYMPAREVQSERSRQRAG